jgi:hypothetical protein
MARQFRCMAEASRTVFQAVKKNQNIVILSEAKNLSLFVLLYLIEERFFASLKMTEKIIFCSLFSLSDFKFAADLHPNQTG